MKRIVACVLLLSMLCSCAGIPKTETAKTDKSENVKYEDVSKEVYEETDSETASDSQTDAQTETELEREEESTDKKEGFFKKPSFLKPIKKHSDKKDSEPSKKAPVKESTTKQETKKETQVSPETTTKPPKRPIVYKQIKAVWISCYELPKATCSKADFTKKVDSMFKAISDFGLNTVYVHTRAYCDAMYSSKIFPWSKQVCGGKNPGYDPLKIMVSSAKKYNLSIHAWINPFRVSSSKDVSALPSGSPAFSLMKKNKSDVLVLSNGIYLNPASPECHKLVYSGVREILKNYDVDGIHIDDYFYPTTDKKVDSKEYEAYKSKGGSKGLSDWRRASVSAFVAGLYSLTKSYGMNKVLSISPSGNLKYNRDRVYADIPLWLSKYGYADVIIPQLYFGFEHDKFPFESLANDWSKLKQHSKMTLVPGLAVCKCGCEDSYAGSGSQEWKENSDIIWRQVKYSHSLKNYKGVALFSYSYIFSKKINKNVKKEMQILKNML